MNKEEYIKREEGAMLHTYNRFPVVLEKGRESISMIRMEKNIWILRQGLR